MADKKESLHHAYLLRCWREKETPSGPIPRWQFSVEDVLQHRPQRGLGSLEALVDFLRADQVGTGGNPES
jgi:hypothetical protein